MKRKLVGYGDLVRIVVVAGTVGGSCALLLGHLRVRHEVLELAHERSDVAYRIRQAEEQARHLQLEERIRQASVDRSVASAGYRAATHAQRVRLEGEGPSAPEME